MDTVCKHCGEELAEGGKFCVYCGRAAEPEAPAPRSSKRKKRESGEPHILLRILFCLCAVILAVHTLGSLAVGVCGKPAKATKVSLSFSKKQPNGGRNDFLWTLDYHFIASNGKEYTGFTTWHGTRWAPDQDYGKHHVNYLSFFPHISRYQKQNSLLEARDLGEGLAQAGRTLFTTALGGVASWFLLFLAFPALPFFKFGKKRKRTRRPR